MRNHILKISHLYVFSYFRDIVIVHVIWGFAVAE